MALTKPTKKSSLWRLSLGERRVLLFIGDTIMAWLALGFGLYFWASAQRITDFVEFIFVRTQTWIYFLPFLWPILLIELYDNHKAADRRETMRGIAMAALIGIVIYAGVYFSSTPRSLPRRGIAGFVVAASFLTLFWRLIYIRVFTAPQFMRHALLAGAGSTGQALLQVINNLNPTPFHLVGLVDDDKQKIGKKIEGYPVFGGSGDLLETIEKYEISEVFVAISGRMESEMFQTLLNAQELGVEITRMPVAYEELLGRVPVHHLEADWILRSFVDEARVNSFYELAKRILDFMGGLVGVIILSILAPFMALAIYLDTGWPVVFRQTRAGKGGRPYSILKFRTMHQNAEKDGDPQFASESDERTTPIGRFMRRTRLDEWPQFINVLRGEMSLVGPRPERPALMEHFEEQIPFYRGRLLVKPGITGWAQVNFGYAASMEEMSQKLEYDLYYIKHRNIFLDLGIILRTIGTVIGFSGR